MQRRRFLASAAVMPALAAGSGGAAVPALAEEIAVFGRRWQVISASDWKVEEDVLHLMTARPQQASPRRPVQFALARTEPLARFTLEVEVLRRQPKGSLIIVYAWQRDGYFNYVHLSDDPAARVEVHNGIFHCFGGDRVRISPLEGPGALAGPGWRKVKVAYDGAKGLAEAWVDGQTSPSLRAVDLSLGAGRIGLGSFFDTASFRAFRIRV